MKRREKQEKESFKHRFSSLLEVPPEIVSDLPKVVILGNKEITVENFLGLIEYTMQHIRILTNAGVLVIDGIHLEAVKMTSDYIKVKGTILQVNFLQ